MLNSIVLYNPIQNTTFYAEVTPPTQPEDEPMDDAPIGEDVKAGEDNQLDFVGVDVTDLFGYDDEDDGLGFMGASSPPPEPPRPSVAELVHRMDRMEASQVADFFDRMEAMDAREEQGEQEEHVYYNYLFNPGDLRQACVLSHTHSHTITHTHMYHSSH